MSPKKARLVEFYGTEDLKSSAKQQQLHCLDCEGRLVLRQAACSIFSSGVVLVHGRVHLRTGFTLVAIQTRNLSGYRCYNVETPEWQG